jgi:hypothetical protein
MLQVVRPHRARIDQNLIAPRARWRHDGPASAPSEHRDAGLADVGR